MWIIWGVMYVLVVFCVYPRNKPEQNKSPSNRPTPPIRLQTPKTNQSKQVQVLQKKQTHLDTLWLLLLQNRFPLGTCCMWILPSLPLPQSMFLPRKSCMSMMLWHPPQRSRFLSHMLRFWRLFVDYLGFDVHVSFWCFPPEQTQTN